MFKVTNTVPNIWEMLNLLFHFYKFIKTKYRIKTTGKSDEKNSHIVTASCVRCERKVGDKDAPSPNLSEAPLNSLPNSISIFGFVCLPLHHSVPARILLSPFSRTLP